VTGPRPLSYFRSAPDSRRNDRLSFCQLSPKLPNERVLAFYNDRGTAQPHMKEGKYALKGTRLYSRRCAANAVRLQLYALAYNLANFPRTIATPEAIKSWSLTSRRERLTKTGTRLVKHARYGVIQMAEAGLSRSVFSGILSLINGPRGPPVIMAAAPTNAETMAATRGGTAEPALILAFCRQIASNRYSACTDAVLSPQTPQGTGLNSTILENILCGGVPNEERRFIYVNALAC
jgi:hypothetical protein